MNFHKVLARLGLGGSRPVTRKATTLARPMTIRQPAICKIQRLATLPTTEPCWGHAGAKWASLAAKKYGFSKTWDWVDICGYTVWQSKIIQNPHSRQLHQIGQVWTKRRNHQKYPLVIQHNGHGKNYPCVEDLPTNVKHCQFKWLC